jgi:hypothetical protein
MARRNNEPAHLADKAKVRVLFAEVEGSNESVQEAMKAMLSAVGRPVRMITDQKPNGNTTVLLPHSDRKETDEIIDHVEVETLPEDSAPPSARKPRGTGKRVDRNAGLKLVPDLDFRPRGQLPLKEFVDEKNPKNDLETTLLVVYYMQKFMNLSKIGPEHVMTAFKKAGKPIPADVKQTIRNVKKTKIWLNFSDIEDVRTTTQGENFIDHEMEGANNS